jgi:hypothetical protein
MVFFYSLEHEAKASRGRVGLTLPPRCGGGIQETVVVGIQVAMEEEVTVAGIQAVMVNTQVGVVVEDTQVVMVVEGVQMAMVAGIHVCNFFCT